MSTFLLSNASFNEKAKELSFLAKATQFLYIDGGTKEMIAEMLDDLGVKQCDFEGWTIDHFLTDYLLDEPLSDDWKEIWAQTWEIKVHLTEKVQFEMAATNLVDTLARDRTSSGDLATLFPSKCVLIADFYDSESLSTAKKILPLVRLLRENEAHIDTLRSQVPELSEYLLVMLRQEYLEQETLYERIPEDLSIRQRAELPLQLIVTVGTFTEEFFEDDATLACVISDLIHKLGGTTTWNERTNPHYHEPYRQPEGLERYYAADPDGKINEV